MIVRKIASIAIFLSLPIACSDSSSSDKAETVDAERLVQTEESIPIDTSEAGTVTTTPEGQGQTQLTGLLEDLLALTPTLTLVGTLAPPTVGSASLQASDIVVNGSKVYVAYNTAGDSLVGGIDVIDISTPTAPVLASQSLYSDIDINKVAVNGSFLYAVGATAAGDGGAVIQKIALDASGKLTAARTSASLRSAASATTAAYAGTSVVASTNYVYALSGNNGGLSILNASDLSLSAFTAIDEARDVNFDATKASLYVVSGKTASAEAAVKHYNLTTGAVDSAYNITLPNAKVDAGKSTLFTGSLAQIATAGSGGVRLLCLGDKSTLGVGPNPSVAGVAADDQVANAATFGNGLMFVANGGAGVSVYAVNVPLIQIGCLGVTVNYLGRFSLGDDASVNNVYYSNGYLVAATGTKGFKIIRVQQSVLATLLMLL